MKHKHYDLILAWTEGKNIQVQVHDQWFDDDSPTWARNSYRIKPAKHKFRVAQMRNTLSGNCWMCFQYANEPLLSSKEFVQYLTDWIEYDENSSV